MKPDGTCSSDQGLVILRKYVAPFSLDHTPGIEIFENEPQISSEDPERSAMKQGIHSYTNAQLSRYVAALANRGNVFELSLLDKLTDSGGNLIKDYIPTVNLHVDAVDSIWDVVQAGMRRVITNSSAKSIFSDLPAEAAGKTGIAQEGESRSDHAFFVSFTPYSHSEIAVTVNIPCGCAGTSTTTLSKKAYEYYCEHIILEQIESSGALGVSNVNIDDQTSKRGDHIHNTVVIKGGKTEVTVILGPGLSSGEPLEAIGKKLRESARFWGLVQMILTLEGRELAVAQEFATVDTITKNSQIKILCLLDTDTERIERCEKALNDKPMELNSQTERLCRGILRRGDCLESEASIMIIGNVDHGARVTAKGDVIVLGELKGTVTAGTSGSPQAIVLVLDMVSLQIHIRDLSGRSNERDKRLGRSPVIVLVEDGATVMRSLKKSSLNNMLSFA